MKAYEISILQSVIALIVIFALRTIVIRLIILRLRSAEFNLQRKKITIKALNLLYTLVLSALLAGIWGLKGEQVLAFITSVLAVLGVGFFAQWSLLSNITSGILLYFNHPLKIGDYINIVDKDFPLKGTIEDISLFFLHVRNDDGIVYTIPNSIVIQKTLSIGRHDKVESEDQEENLRED